MHAGFNVTQESHNVLSSPQEGQRSLSVQMMYRIAPIFPVGSFARYIHPSDSSVADRMVSAAFRNSFGSTGLVRTRPTKAPRAPSSYSTAFRAPHRTFNPSRFAFWRNSAEGFSHMSAARPVVPLPAKPS